MDEIRLLKYFTSIRRKVGDDDVEHKKNMEGPILI